MTTAPEHVSPPAGREGRMALEHADGVDRVRNVAQPVIHHACSLYCLGDDSSDGLPCEPAAAEAGVRAVG